MPFAYLPAGQGSLNVSKAKKLKKEVMKEWPKDVPSFEAWCAATCYDPREKDGGKMFHVMMYWVLADVTTTGTSASIVKGKATLNLLAENKKYEAQLGKQNPENYQVFEGAADTKGDLTGGFIGKSDRGCNQAPGNGGPMWLQYTQDSQFSTHAHVGFWCHSPHQVQSAQGIFPHGKMAWAESAGIKVAPTNERQFTQSAKDQDKEGTLCFGNRLAAYYGLYYYPDCSNEEYQWHLKVTVAGKPFVVRMRLPNPNYEYSPMIHVGKFTDGEEAWPLKPVNLFSNWDLIAHVQQYEGKKGKAAGEIVKMPTVVSRLQPWTGDALFRS